MDYWTRCWSQVRTQVGDGQRQCIQHREFGVRMEKGLGFCDILVDFQTGGNCNDQFHLSPDMAPKGQTWAQHVSWPPSHQVCLRHGKLSEVVSRLILKLREVVPLAWETIYSLGEVTRVTSMGLPNLGLKSVTEV